MSRVQSLEPTVSEPLTWAEIRERYPDQWVCLIEIDRIEEDNFEFRTARVAGHGKTRREPLDQARPLRDRYEEIGHYYTGRIVAPMPRFFL
jgi:DNA primase